MASDGGAASAVPGVTTFGTGSHTSVSLGFGWAPGGVANCIARRGREATIEAAQVKKVEFGIRINSQQ
jgi:hypothetical protein